MRCGTGECGWYTASGPSKCAFRCQCRFQSFAMCTFPRSGTDTTGEPCRDGSFWWCGQCFLGLPLWWWTGGNQYGCSGSATTGWCLWITTLSSFRGIRFACLIDESAGIAVASWNPCSGFAWIAASLWRTDRLWLSAMRFAGRLSKVKCQTVAKNSATRGPECFQRGTGCRSFVQMVKIFTG